MAKVSVIIPTYNRAKLLRKTLLNILQQTEPAAEIIVVDDHSTDKTRDMLASEFKQEVRVYSNDGKGPGAARNTGLKYATGELIKFFDSDDLMTDNTLLEQKKALAVSGRGFVYGPYLYATEQEDGNWKSVDNTLINFYPFSEKKTLTQWMCRGLFITIPGMLFRKKIIDKVGPWREDVIAYEDWEYLWRLGIQESFPAHTNKSAFIYRLHGEQTTLNRSSDLARDREKLAIFKSLYDRRKEPSELTFNDWYFFVNQVHQTERMHGVLEKGAFIPYNQFFHKLYWQYVRAIKKMGRIRTNTSWQPEHGPKKDAALTRDLLKQATSQGYSISHD